MVEVDQDGVGGFEGLLSQAPLGHVLQHIRGDAFHTVGHGGNAQIRAVGDQGCQQGGEEMWNTGCLFVWTAKRVGETTPGINLHQEIFNLWGSDSPKLASFA